MTKNADTTSLSWPQVNAWRLSRHLLATREKSANLLSVAERLCGLHAQMLSAAELHVWARVDGTDPDAVRRALWTDRTLVKTWAMRGTLHLLAAADYPLYVAAMSTRTRFRHPTWLKYFGLTLAEMEGIIEGVRTALDGRVLTREELASEVSRITGQPHLGNLLRSGWGSFLKPAASLGYLCFGPSQGQQVTFVRPDQWLGLNAKHGAKDGDQQEIEPEAALRELLRRFLSTYGPATRDEFARWFGVEPRDVRPTWESLSSELVPVSVEGWKAFALAETVGAMRSAQTKGHPTVNLLPNFDLYTLGISPHSKYLLDPEHKSRVYRKSAWLSPIVLVDGRIEGVWEYEKRRGKVEVQMKIFVPPSAEVKRGMKAEAQRLGEYLGLEVAAGFKDS